MRRSFALSKTKVKDRRRSPRDALLHMVKPDQCQMRLMHNNMLAFTNKSKTYEKHIC